MKKPNSARKLILLFAVALFIIPATVHGQISEGGTPWSFSLNQTSSGRIMSKNYSLPVVNNNEELKRAAKIEAECQTCRKEYFGTGLSVHINIKQEARLTKINEGNVWLLNVTSGSALGMQFFFDRFTLPPGAKLFIYNEDKSAILGAFTEKNNHEDGKFATQVIPGNNVVLEYFEPSGVPFEGQLGIYKVIHVFKDIYPTKANYYGDSGDCNVDINCPDGANYQDVKGAVCRILFYDQDLNLSRHCTGALLNTTSSSRQNVVLTANHCITPGNPDFANLKRYRYWEWIFEFGYEVANCTSPSDPFVNTKTINGAFLLSKGKLSDYALLDIGVSIPTSYNVVYLGWDKSYNSIPTKAAGIHHPSGDVKKISLENDAPVPVNTEPVANTENFGEGTGVVLTDWRVRWNKGVTEGGSSGSPLLNQNKLVVGQLRGGESECPSVFGPDYYGRLAISWNNSDPEYSGWPLSHWLDYNKTGVTSLATFNPVLPQCSNGYRDVNEAGIDCGGPCPSCDKQFPQTCYNGFKDGSETDVDCGGDCINCATGSCYNGIKDGDETGIDCGGSKCGPCVISTLTPSVVLGDFNYNISCFGPCKLQNVNCNADGWIPFYGMPLVGSGGGESKNHHLVLTGRNSQIISSDPYNYDTPWCKDCYASSGVYKNYIFEKNKKYILSLRLLTGENYGLEVGPRNLKAVELFRVRLTKTLTGSVCNGAQFYNKMSHMTGILGQAWNIPHQLIFEKTNYKNDFNEGKAWQTFFVEFTPNDNYTQLQMIMAPMPPHGIPSDYYKYRDENEQLHIDDIFLYDPETFFNPCCQNEKTVFNTSDITTSKIVVNNLVTAAGNGGVVNIASGSNVTFGAKMVVLKPGFSAASGSVFVAKNEYCTTNISTTAVNTTQTPVESCVLPGNRSLEKYASDFGKVFWDEEVVESKPETDVQLHPNPTNGYLMLSIAFNTPKQHIEVVVSNSYGTVLQRKQFSPAQSINEELDLSNAPAGLYFITVIADAESSHRKIIKK